MCTLCRLHFRSSSELDGAIEPVVMSAIGQRHASGVPPVCCYQAYWQIEMSWWAAVI